MISFFSAIVLLGVLIAIHEFGHFIVGRMCNIHIYRFSIGMGPVIYKKLDKHGTEFALSALPLGGYVAFHTEKAIEGELDLQQPLTPEQNKNTFESKPKWQRALVMLAGPVANFILAVGILSLIFVNSVERQFIPEVSNISSQYLQSNSNLKAGDILTAINEKQVSQHVKNEIISNKILSAYVRIDVNDKYGVLSDITNIFASNKVSIKRVLQNPFKSKNYSSIVIITHKSKDLYINRTLKTLNKKKYLIKKSKLIRIDENY